MNLVYLLKHYNRKHISELADQTNLTEEKAETYVVKLINSREIKGNWDKESKGITSLYTFEEFDVLIKQFEEWERTGEGKKV